MEPVAQAASPSPRERGSSLASADVTARSSRPRRWLEPDWALAAVAVAVSAASVAGAAPSVAAAAAAFSRPPRAAAAPAPPVAAPPPAPPSPAAASAAAPPTAQISSCFNGRLTVFLLKNHFDLNLPPAPSSHHYPRYRIVHPAASDGSLGLSPSAASPSPALSIKIDPNQSKNGRKTVVTQFVKQ